MTFREILTRSCVAITAVACCTTPPQTGAVFVSAISVTDWAAYGSKFQPKFSLTEKEALGLAVADTLQLERAYFNAASASVRIKALQDTTELVDPTDVEKPAAAPAASAAKSILDASKLAVDPRLQYLLATALWQEVQMLNLYVRDAAILKDKRIIPYVVRLQVSGLPDSVESSYVADIDLEFSSKDSKSCVRPVDVVPLLINDHIEAAVASKRDEELRRLSIGLAAMLKGVGVAMDLDSFQSEVNQSLGREFNSLLTVAKNGESQLRVRLGARRAGNRQYFATSEPRFLTVLVLVEDQTQSTALTAAEVDGVQPPDAEANRGADSCAKVDVRYTVRCRDPLTGRQIVQHPATTFSTLFALPREAWLRADQTAFASDDGEKTVVTLNDATGFLPGEVVATWFFKAVGSETLHAVTAGDVTYDAAIRQLTFAFPSLSKHGIAPVAAGVPARFARREMVRPERDRADELLQASRGVAPSRYSPPAIDLSEVSARSATPERSFVVKLLTRYRTLEASDGTKKQEPVHLFYPWVYKAQGKAPLLPGAEISVNRSKIAHTSNRAEIKVSFALPAASSGAVPGFQLHVGGADAALVAVAPNNAAAMSGTGNFLDLSAGGVVTLGLDGLYEGGKVTLTMKGPKGYAVPEPIVMDVIK